MMDIISACRDPNLFAPFFRDPKSFANWFAFLKALFALPMSEREAASFHQFTGREHLPKGPASEAWLVIGRRGGKSRFMALTGVFLACFKDYRQFLAPGEQATVMIIAADRKQARVVARYVRAMLTSVPMLRKLVSKESTEGFELKNGVNIEIGTASFRSTRGYTYAAVLADEIAFWRTDDSANPDFEILAAIRPGMATIPNALLLCASSPYAKRGALWDAYRRYWGKNGAPLVWRADTMSMNPSVSETIIQQEMDRDTARARAEYFAEFRNDIEQFVALETVERCIRTNLRVRPPIRVTTTKYHAFVDPSGGRSDSMTLAIGHKEKDGLIFIDQLLESKPPFSPENTVWEFAQTLKLYGVTSVQGDRYGGEWPREAFRKQGITYDIAKKNRSEMYLELLPLLTNESIDLLNNDRCVNQLVNLERRVARGGRESIDHPPGGHDDLANAVAGVAHLMNYKTIITTRSYAIPV